MSEERIRALLQRADQAAGKPTLGPVSTGRIRRRIHRRRVAMLAVPVTAAAAVIFGVSLWVVCTRLQSSRPESSPQRMVSLEARVKQLQVQTDAALKLVREVLERDRQARHTAALEAELASIPDPMAEIDRQLDKTAFVLVYQADRLYKELNQTESAVAAYKEVIQLFPKNRWADVARERLSEIEKHKSSQIDTPGESKWKT